ncbi:unnamed protein product [Dicrocoelium dendriticum]|nr:unnamed protein product [Dicrocoelium dendriticum]
MSATFPSSGASVAPFKKLTMSGCNAGFCVIRYNQTKTITIEFQADEDLGDFNVKLSVLLSKPSRRFLLFDLDMDYASFGENACKMSKYGTNYTISHPLVIKKLRLKVGKLPRLTDRT